MASKFYPTLSIKSHRISRTTQHTIVMERIVFTTDQDLDSKRGRDVTLQHGMTLTSNIRQRVDANTAVIIFKKGTKVYLLSAKVRLESKP